MILYTQPNNQPRYDFPGINFNGDHYLNSKLNTVPPTYCFNGINFNSGHYNFQYILFHY